jgi:hypothetical protein
LAFGCQNHMIQPDGFVDPKRAEKVCKFKKSIYGLNQIFRSWHIRFDNEIQKIGFHVKLK